MFLDIVSGLVTDLSPNDHTRFQCSVTLTIPTEDAGLIGPGTLVAADCLLAKAREHRYTVLQIVDAFPEPPKTKTKTQKNISLTCTAIPIGIDLVAKGKKLSEILQTDSFPAYNANVSVLSDETTASVIHQIAPESHSEENGSRVDIGSYGANPEVMVGLDYRTLFRGNAAIISSRPRARTTITNNMISALLRSDDHPLHVVYFDVNNTGTMSLINLIHQFDNSMVLSLNDKFIPQSIYHSLKQPSDRQTHKRAVLDYLDMMILPSIMEQYRHDFIYPVSNLLRSDKFAIYRAHEQTIDEFINEIRIDILEGVDTDVEEYISDILDGIASTYQNERFNDKNTKDILEMIDEFSQEAKIHAARRTLYDVRAEVQSAFDSFSKDVPSTARKTMNDIILRLNDETKSSFTVVQGQKTTDVLRFTGLLLQGLVDERLKRLKIRVPVLFIFNNADDYIPRVTSGGRESGGDRFQEILQVLLANGRRHGLGFCLTLEQASALEGTLARRIQSFFIGSLRFREEPEKAAELINVSEELLRPAVVFEDGCFLFASADSPYHRRVPIPVCTKRNTDVLYDFIGGLAEEQERRRKEIQAQEEERQRNFEKQRKEEQQRQEERRKQEEERRRKEEETRKQQAADRQQDDKQRSDDQPRDKRNRKKRGGRDRRNAEESAPAAEINEQLIVPLESEEELPEVIIAEEDEQGETEVIIAEVEIDSPDTIMEEVVFPIPEESQDTEHTEEPLAEEKRDTRQKKTRRGGRRHRKPTDGDREKPKESPSAADQPAPPPAPEPAPAEPKPADTPPVEEKKPAAKKPNRRGGRRSPKKS